jgi:hypothetical protein
MVIEIGRNLQIAVVLLGLVLGWWHYSRRRP